jgi:FAD-dependent urate hydroxylase
MSGTNSNESGIETQSANDSDADVSGKRESLQVGNAEDPGHDRQVLVTGCDLAARSTAGFLDHAGLDPVLAVGEHHVPDSTVVLVWQSGLELLERIGMRRPIEAVSTPVNKLGRAGSSRRWSAPPSVRPPLVAVRHGRLRSLFDRQFSDWIRTIDESIESIESTEKSVFVSFEHGLTESFDTIVTTDQADIPRRGSESLSEVHHWAFDWPSAVPGPEIPTEAWSRDSAAVSVPVGDSVRARLISANSAAAEAPLAIDRLSEQFGRVFGTLGDAISELDESALQYQRIPFAVPTTLSAGNVVLVGPDVHAAIPGDGLGPSLSIEDGWVLADALTYGPMSVEEALSEYETRRRRRAAVISSTGRSNLFLQDAPDSLSGVTLQLWARRSIAFEHLFDRDTSEVAESIPDQL